MLLENSQWRQNIYNVYEVVSSEIVNPALIFDKYFLWESYKGYPTNTSNNRSSRENNYKKRHLEKIIQCKFPLKSDQYQYLNDRKNSLPRTIPFFLNTKTRVIVNHGSESILENSIAIHPYYGFPIIPGSAIKGITRHYCEEYENMNEELIKKIFGNFPLDKNSQEGGIIFLDAWPKTMDKKNLGEFFELDVFTPHYQNYYQKNEFPRDDQNPIPVYFLAMKKGVEFEFAISPSSRYNNDTEKIDLQDVKRLITNALKTYGVGAKTGSSYGYFE